MLLISSCQHISPDAVQRSSHVNTSPIIFKFATVGDSRQQPGEASNSAQDERWLQATAIWSRMLLEIEAQKPQALIFNGDMIYGYTQDMAAIDRQYAFWRGMVAGLMERGTYVLPVPGNHEVQVPIPLAEGGTKKLAQVTHENAWRENMGDLILNSSLWNKTTGAVATAFNIENTPARGTDGITTDQRQLSYSFDSKKIHIAVINTDPVGFDESAPVQWLATDLAAAKARGATKFLVFGHKPAFTYFGDVIADQSVDGGKNKMPKIKTKEDGFATRLAMREKFWDVIETYDATYFCGHQHVYHASQPRHSAGGKAWQIMVGTAGSPLSFGGGKSKNRNDAMYAWAEVSVRENGSVGVVVRGFDELAGKTTIIEQLEL
jgi:Calcineurin-like phosphoesterase